MSYALSTTEWENRLLFDELFCENELVRLLQLLQHPSPLRNVAIPQATDRQSRRWQGFFLEGSAKRDFLKGAAKLCFSLICGKLLGKCHFQGFVFAASYRGNCNFGGFYLQQAFRKLSGKSHLQALLLQAIGEVGVFFSSKFFRNYCGSSISRVSVLQQCIGEVPLWGVFCCIKLFGKLHL